MKKSVEVMIGGHIYRLVAEEDTSYTRKVSSYVNNKVSELIENGLSSSDAMVLTAVNLADEYFKEVETSENLRAQLKDYIEESSKVKSELTELRRELSRLKKEYLA